MNTPYPAQLLPKMYWMYHCIRDTGCMLYMSFEAKKKFYKYNWIHLHYKIKQTCHADLNIKWIFLWTYQPKDLQLYYQLKGLQLN